jgi:hypothetical protein
MSHRTTPEIAMITAGIQCINSILADAFAIYFKVKPNLAGMKGATSFGSKHRFFVNTN